MNYWLFKELMAAKKWGYGMQNCDISVHIVPDRARLKCRRWWPLFSSFCCTLPGHCTTLWLCPASSKTYSVLATDGLMCLTRSVSCYIRCRIYFKRHIRMWCGCMCVCVVLVIIINCLLYSASSIGRSMFKSAVCMHKVNKQIKKGYCTCVCDIFHISKYL